MLLEVDKKDRRWGYWEGYGSIYVVCGSIQSSDVGLRLRGVYKRCILL